MRCPCQNENNENIVITNNSNNIIANCDYTTEQIINWKNLVFCYKDLYQEEDKKNINKALGIILSALRVNPCLLKTELDLIKPFILKIINLNIC